MIGLIGIFNGILYSKNKMSNQYIGKEYIIWSHGSSQFYDIKYVNGEMVKTSELKWED